MAGVAVRVSFSFCQVIQPGPGIVSAVTPKLASRGLVSTVGMNQQANVVMTAGAGTENHLQLTKHLLRVLKRFRL